MTGTMCGIIIALGIVSFIAFMVLRVKKHLMPAVIAKAITSCFFVATAGYAVVTKPQEAVYSMLIMLALVAGLLGDIWLDLKWVFKKEEKQFTYWGFCSFLVGHIIFLVAIILHTNADADKKWYILCAVLSIIIPAIQMFITRKQNDYTGYKEITYIYTAFLVMTLLSSSLNMYFDGFSKNTVMFAIGALLFLLSDAVLCSTYFDRKQNKNTPAYVILNHFLYYAAQFTIATSLLFI